MPRGKGWLIGGVSEEVRQEVTAAAEQTGMPLGQWIEKALRKAIVEGLEEGPAGVEMGELEAMVRRVVAEELEPLRASLDRQRAKDVITTASSPVELVRERLRRRRGR
jgi:hypothetical protein